MIKNYKQYINEDLKNKKIYTEVKCGNLEQLYPNIKIKYNNEYKIVISSDKILKLDNGFYQSLKNDKINKDDIVFENCKAIVLYNIPEFTKVSDYGKFGENIKEFDCSYCENLTSLDGSPVKVSGNFNCIGCTSLASLQGSPKEVGGYFSCSYCYNLTSLDGAPEKVDGSFYCRGHNDDLVKLAKEKYGSKVIS